MEQAVYNDMGRNQEVAERIYGTHGLYMLRSVLLGNTEV
jgi:hypothetical protein